MFGNGLPGPGCNVVPIRFIVIDASGQHDVYARPYEINASGQQYAMMTGIGERLARESMLTAGTVAGYANQLLIPSAATHGTIQVPNGWMQKRLRFIIEFMITDGYGEKTYEVLSGYTDYDDPSYGGVFGGEMRLFLNNVVRLRESQRFDDFGQVYTTKALVNSAQLLSVKDGITSFGNYTQAPSNTVMTPSNILAKIEWNTSAWNTTGGQPMDTRVMHGNGLGLTASNRRNNMASSYIADTLIAAKNASIQAGQQTFGGIIPSESLIYASARDNAISREVEVHSDKVLSMLVSNTSYINTGSVTWREMLGLFPTLDTIGQHIRPGVTMNEFNQYMPDPDGYTLSNLTGWQGAQLETQMGWAIVNAIPSLMVDTLLSECTISCTNQTMMGQPETSISARSFLGDGVDITSLMQTFVSRFETEFVPMISRGNAIDFRLNVASQIAGDTKITMSLSGGAVFSYTAPSYCDHRSPPTVTREEGRLNLLAADIQKLTTPFIQQVTRSNATY